MRASFLPEIYYLSIYLSPRPQNSLLRGAHPTNPRRAAHQQPGDHAHCDAQPAVTAAQRGRASPSHPAPASALPHKLHTPQPAPGCVEHTAALLPRPHLPAFPYRRVSAACTLSQDGPRSNKLQQAAWCSASAPTAHRYYCIPHLSTCLDRQNHLHRTRSRSDRAFWLPPPHPLHILPFRRVWAVAHIPWRRFCK